MRIIIISWLMVGVFVLTSSACGIELPSAKITLKVVDENGAPIEGASLGIGFERNTGSGTEKVPVGGKTDKNGIFTGSAKTINYASYIVKKDGYYQSQGVFRFKENKLGKWQPGVQSKSV